MASEIPTIADLVFVLVLLSIPAAILLVCRYFNTRPDVEPAGSRNWGHLPPRNIIPGREIVRIDSPE